MSDLTKIKLTKPQHEFLVQVAKSPSYAVEHYKPAQTLIRLKLMTRNWRGIHDLTDAGRMLYLALGPS